MPDYFAGSPAGGAVESAGFAASPDAGAAAGAGFDSFLAQPATSAANTTIETKSFFIVGSPIGICEQKKTLTLSGVVC
jgi:hypothetical protein